MHSLPESSSVTERQREALLSFKEHFVFAGNLKERLLNETEVNA